MEMCENKFLQMYSFFTVLNSLYSSNMSCIPLFHAISTAISKFPPYSLHRHPDSPNLLDSYPDFRHFPHSNTYSSYFSDSVPRFHISVFTDSLVGFEPLRIYFKKIVTLVQKQTLPFVTTA